MHEKQISKLIDRLEDLLNCAEFVEHELHGHGLITAQLFNKNEIARILQYLKKLQETNIVQHALARIDFNDDYYEYIRAIDGDTIVVKPPLQLQGWMKDIHVRLYGLETPELWEELGKQYQQHLEDLCAIDAQKRLRIVWERERTGTNYEGFPMSSFERGIGHLFFEAPNGHFYYINALMHILKHCTLFRGERNLLRGNAVVESLDVDLPWKGRCQTRLEASCEVVSDTFRNIQDMGPPVCLVSYPKLPNLDPRKTEFEEKISQTIIDNWNNHCPFDREIQRHQDYFLSRVFQQKASPFDLALTEISLWSQKQHGLT